MNGNSRSRAFLNEFEMVYDNLSTTSLSDISRQHKRALRLRELKTGVSIRSIPEIRNGVKRLYSSSNNRDWGSQTTYLNGVLDWNRRLLKQNLYDPWECSDTGRLSGMQLTPYGHSHRCYISLNSTIRLESLKTLLFLPLWTVLLVRPSASSIASICDRESIPSAISQQCHSRVILLPFLPFSLLGGDLWPAC